MIEARRIDFILAGGTRLGLGHVMRCRSIAEAAIARGLRVRLYLELDPRDGDSAAARLRTLEGIDRIHAWSEWTPTDAAGFTIVDHPFEKHPWLEKLEETRSRVAVLDDDRIGDFAPIVILPGLHHAPAADDAERNRLVGPRFSILAEPHRKHRAQPLASRGTLLLSMGGADPGHLAPRLAPWLADALAESGRAALYRRRIAVLGPAFEDPSGHARVALAEAGFETRNALSTEEIARLMGEARLAIVGFGTSVTELSWHGTPQVFVTHHASDVAAAASLEERGLGRSLGHGEALEADPTRERLRQIFESPDRLDADAARARAAIGDGDGIERILDHLVESSGRGDLVTRARSAESRTRASHTGRAAPSTLA